MYIHMYIQCSTLCIHTAYAGGADPAGAVQQAEGQPTLTIRLVITGPSQPHNNDNTTLLKRIIMIL